MNKIVFVLTILAVIIALVAYRKSVNEVEPEVLPDDVWWGLESDRINDSGNTYILPFQINISDRVNNYGDNHNYNIKKCLVKILILMTLQSLIIFI